MLRKVLAIFLFALIVAAAPATAQEVAQPSRAETLVPPQPEQGEAQSHIELSGNDRWAKEMVMVILLGFFVPAAIVGPWVRRLAAADIPELHDREEQSALTASQHEPGHTRKV